MGWRLVGTLEGQPQRIPLRDGRNRLGRSVEKTTIVLEHDGISRLHA